MNILANFKSVTTLIFDVDGVLTNSQLLITERGELLRSMNTRDGYAIKRAIQVGLQVVIITGGNSKGVISRLKGLGVIDIYTNSHPKIDDYEELCSIYDLQKSKILYMGDDLPDYEVMQAVGLACCPANATPEIQAISQYVSPFNGGEGCVRDVIEKVLKLQNKWH